MRQTLRQIIEEPSFAADRARLKPDARRLDEILEAVILRVCRDPEGGYPLPNTDVYVVLTAEFPDAPVLAVLYRFDNDHTFVLGLELY